MSISEMKLVAINEIAKLEDENAVKEILMHLEKISSGESTSKSFNLYKHFEAVKDKYGDVLQKLAQ